MKNITKKYSNGEITVVWKPDLCVHAAVCFTELPKVFIPYERPWVRMDGASTDEIIDVVNRCPTDALTYYRNNVKDEEIKNKAEHNTEISIKKNGPFIVKGDFKITNVDGNEIVCAKLAALCRCGLSKKQPFCDGSHKGKFNIDD